MYKAHWIRRCIFFLSLCICVDALPLYAQNISTQSLSTVNVDNLSDSQIRQYLQRLKASGYTVDQATKIAIAKGMSEEQVAKLKSRIQKIQSGSAQTMFYNPVDTSLHDTGSMNIIADTMNMQERAPLTNPRIFGAKLFNNPNMTFVPDLRIPTPQNYRLGPDDEIVIDIYGYSQADYHLTVSNEGSVNIPYIGIVYLNGLTLQDATAKIRSKLSAVYSGIRNGNTKLQVSIGRIRSIKVTLLGEVNRPGTYTLPSLATVFNALYASGGPNDFGSFRNIEIIRNNEVVEKLDVYDFLMKGDQRQNIRLQDQDVVRIPVYKTRVDISGQVKRPGLYEIRDQESLSDLLTFAGRFTDSAYRARIKVQRVTSTERKMVDVPQEEFASFTPLTGDQFLVDSILNRYANRVSIEGALYRPGQFELTEGLTLHQLIEKADGLREDAFLPRGYILRLNSDMTTSMVEFDVAKIMSGQVPDIPLKREDQVHVSSIFDLRDAYLVSIQGAVRDTGTYFYADSMSVEDLILQAGGFTEDATPYHIEISRRKKDSLDPFSTTSEITRIFQVNTARDLQLQSSHFTLQPFDMVVVRKIPGYEEQKQVRIEGEVLYPGVYTLEKKNEKISTLIKRAGGLTALAYPAGASLKRPVSDEGAGISEQEKLLRFRQFQESMFTSGSDTSQLQNNMEEVRSQTMHNDFVGIDLKKILQNPGARNDLILQEGDVLKIPRRLETVKVNGEIMYPVTAAFHPGKSVKYYISQGGGFSGNAKRGKVYVVYANGFVKSTSHFLFFRNYPTMEPGAEIFVPQKPERKNRMTPQEILGITSGAASLTAIVITIANLLK